MAAADPQQGQPGVDRLARHRNIQPVLLRIDVVECVARFLAIEPGIKVAATGKYDAVKRSGRAGPPAAVEQAVLDEFGGQQHRFAAAVVHEVHNETEEAVGLSHARVGMCRAAEADRNADAGARTAGR